MLSLIAVSIGFLALASVFDILKNRSIHDILFIMWAVFVVILKLVNWDSASLVRSIVTLAIFSVILAYPFFKKKWIGQADIFAILIMSFTFGDIAFIVKWLALSNMFGVIYMITNEYHGTIKEDGTKSKFNWNNIKYEAFPLFPFLLLGMILSIL